MPVPAHNHPATPHDASTDPALEEMLRLQVVERGINNPTVLNAMRATPRALFFPPGTRDNVYADRAHPIGHGQTISQPYMVALMTERLELQPQHRILEIGTGSGYQTAILARLAAQVFTIERIKPLLDSAFDRILSLGLRNVHFKHADGTTGWPNHAPFDRILIAAGAPALPRNLLLSHLSPNGIAILPVGNDHGQMLLRAQLTNNNLSTTDICPCRFVKLLGSEGWPE
jgi:protein-L-isoaspartate(D-aspartate) O-methyltransferase